MYILILNHLILDEYSDDCDEGVQWKNITTIYRELEFIIAPLSDTQMFYIKYLTMHKVHMYAGAIRQLLYIVVDTVKQDQKTQVIFERGPDPLSPLRICAWIFDSTWVICEFLEKVKLTSINNDHICRLNRGIFIHKSWDIYFFVDDNIVVILWNWATPSLDKWSIWQFNL